MTREERAAGYLGDAYQGEAPSSKIADAIREGKGGVVSIDIAKAAILLAIDAEAAAMREQAAEVAMNEADAWGAFSDAEAVAPKIAAAIRALPATGEE